MLWSFLKNLQTKILKNFALLGESLTLVAQIAFAELIDMSVSYVSKVEQGLTSPTAIALFKMSYILKTPMEEFFKGIDYEKLSS